MSLSRSRAKEKEYNLWHDWHVNLLGNFEHVKNDKSGQLVNKDGSRVIYGSSFTIHGMTDVKDEVSFLGTKQNKTKRETIIYPLLSRKITKFLRSTSPTKYLQMKSGLPRSLIRHIGSNLVSKARLRSKSTSESQLNIVRIL